jgi:stage V sporulation protein G
VEITEIKIKLVPRGANKLKGFASITFDNSFVVKDVRIIQGLKGTIVAMPAKKLTFRCFKCGFKNTLRSKFCSECGRRVHANYSKRNPATGRPVLQVDVAHPINPETRKMIEEKVVAAYDVEAQKQQEALQAAQGEAISQVQNAIRSAGGFADEDDVDLEDFEETQAGAPAAAPAPEPSPVSSPAPGETTPVPPPPQAEPPPQ